MSLIALDTHGFVKRLTAAGFSEVQAEALVDEQRRLVEERLVTRDYLDMRLREQDARIDARFKEVDARFDRLEASIDARFKEVDARFERLETSIDARFKEVDARFERLEASIDTRFKEVDGRFRDLEQRLTIKLGGLMVAGVAAIGLLMKLG